MFQDLKNYVNEYLYNKEVLGVSPSLEEFKRLLTMSIIKECNSGIEVYEGYSPMEITLMLYSPFESDCPVQLNKLSSEEYAMIPIFRQVKRLMEVIEEKKELKLTAKGNLPVKIVKELYSLGISDDFIEAGIYKLAKEQDSKRVRIVRILAHSAGLIKKRKGVLSLTVEGVRNLKDDSLLLKTLIGAFCRKIDWEILDFMNIYGDIIRIEVAFSIVLLARYGTEKRIEQFYAVKNYNAFPLYFESPVSEDTLCWDYNNSYRERIIKGFMKHFGLIEFEPREKMCDSIYLQKTAIFDKLFRIIPPKQ